LHPDLPVMMVTAYGDDELRRRASGNGAAEFPAKPVDFDQLKEQLRPLARRSGVTHPITRDSAVMISSTLPLAKYSCSGS
jgi:DNA-binding response OmpR family regulator